MIAAIVGLFASLFITLPIWFIILYQIMQATNQPAWVWGLYFVYLVLSILITCLTSWIKIEEANK